MRAIALGGSLAEGFLYLGFIVWARRSVPAGADLASIHSLFFFLILPAFILGVLNRYLSLAVALVVTTAVLAAAIGFASQISS